MRRKHLPPRCRYYFVDTTESPLFEIFYVLYSASVAAIVVMYLAKNFLFIGIGLYMVALHDELELHLRRIDDQLDGRRRLDHMRHCIRMHARIIEWV